MLKKIILPKVLIGAQGSLIIASIFAAIILPYLFNVNFYMKFAITLVSLLFPFAMNHLILEYKEDMIQKKLELQIPSLFAHIASKPIGYPFEAIISEIAMDKGALGGEFKKAQGMIIAGFSTEYAIGNIAIENKSQLIKRAISLLLDGYKTGGNYKQAYLDFGEDISQMQRMQMENASASIMHKYTLLAAVGLLIPSIIAILISFVSGLGINEGGILESSAQNGQILPSIIVSLQIYLVLLSAIASAIIAMQEGKIKKAPIYFCILSLLALSIFNAIKGMQLV